MTECNKIPDELMGVQKDVLPTLLRMTNRPLCDKKHARLYPRVFQGCGSEFEVGLVSTKREHGNSHEFAAKSSFSQPRVYQHTQKQSKRPTGAFTEQIEKQEET